MSSVFIDSDVILDVFAHRKPFFIESAKILSLCERHEIQGYTTALVFANIHYLLNKMMSREITENHLRKLRIILDIIPLNRKHVDMALNSQFTDFEDALQHFSAEDQSIDRIITRNISDYKHSSIPVSTPEEFLLGYEASE